MKTHTLLILLCSILTLQACAQSPKSTTETKRLEAKIDSLEYVVLRKDVHFRALEHLSSGDFQRVTAETEDDIYGYNYRVEIYLSEIYKSLYITKIGYWGEGIQRIEYTFEADIENLLGINSEQTNSLEFVHWISPDVFEIKTTEGVFILEILDSKEVQLK